MSGRVYKRVIPIALTFVIGMIITADWFIEFQPLQNFTTTVMNFQVIMTAFMIGFAAANLLIVHGNRIRRNLNSKNYFQVFIALMLLGAMFTSTAIGVIYGSTSGMYRWIYNNINLPLGATATALTFFYMARTMYRLLRPRSIESSLLLVVSIIAIMGNMPLVSSQLPLLVSVQSWLANVLVKATYRSMTIGIGIGGILMGLRTLLGMETGYLGAGD